MPGEPYTPVGRIAKTHGLKGEVSVISYGEASLDVLSGLSVWLVPPPRGLRASRILSVRPGPKGPLVTLEGVTDISLASDLVSRELLIAADDVPEGWFDQEEPDDFTGCSVTDSTHGFLGKVVETIITGANDVWVVEGPHGEILIPVIDEVVLDVDFDGAEIQVALLDGLMPGEADKS